MDDAVQAVPDVPPVGRAVEADIGRVFDQSLGGDLEKRLAAAEDALRRVP